MPAGAQEKIGTFTMPSFSSSSKTVDLHIGFIPDHIKIVQLRAAVSSDTVVGLEWLSAWNSTQKIIKLMQEKVSSEQTLRRLYAASSSSYYLQSLNSQSVSTTSSGSTITAVQHTGEIGVRFPNAVAKNLKGQSYYYVAKKAAKFQAHGSLTAA
jgi:hypothetical protein